MAGGATPGREVVLETDRLLPRPWRVAEAVVQRELWSERDPRVPPHRRIDADGHPTVADLEASIRTSQPSSTGLLAVERKAARDVIGYCGLVDTGRGAVGEPELAFELLRRVWRQDTRPRPRGRFWTGRDRPGTNTCGPPPVIAGESDEAPPSPQVLPQLRWVQRTRRSAPHRSPTRS